MEATKTRPIAGSLPVATARCGNQVKALRYRLAGVERELATPRFLSGATDSVRQHEAQRQAGFRSERDRLNAEIARLEALEGDALLVEFCQPEIRAAAKAADNVPEHVTTLQESQGARPGGWYKLYGTD